MSCARSHRTFDHPSYELSDPLYKPVIDLGDLLDRPGKETLITEGIDVPTDALCKSMDDRDGVVGKYVCSMARGYHACPNI
jgi:hypothetical protein